MKNQIALFGNSSHPPFKAPSCLEALGVLDHLVDHFNHEPTQPLLSTRIANYRKDDKYVVDDIDELSFLFFKLCETLRLDASRTQAYRKLLDQECAMMLDQGTNGRGMDFWRDYRLGINAALSHDTDHAIQEVLSLSSHQLWLRAALALEPSLPAPWPLWPILVQENVERARRNFHGGSENWTRSNHEDSIWASQRVLKDFQELGWFDPKGAKGRPEPELALAMQDARTLLLARCGIYELGQASQA